MAVPEESSSPTPLLDEWRAEVGDEAVAQVVEAARAQIADGTLRGFTDQDELLAYIQGPRRRSA